MVQGVIQPTKKPCMEIREADWKGDGRHNRDLSPVFSALHPAASGTKEQGWKPEVWWRECLGDFRAKSEAGK